MRKVFPYCSHARGGVPTFLTEVVEKYGRHEETRTPDLYRVKAFRINYLQSLTRILRTAGKLVSR